MWSNEDQKLHKSAYDSKAKNLYSDLKHSLRAFSGIGGRGDSGMGDWEVAPQERCLFTLPGECAEIFI